MNARFSRSEILPSKGYLLPLGGGSSRSSLARVQRLAQRPARAVRSAPAFVTPVRAARPRSYVPPAPKNTGAAPSIKKQNIRAQPIKIAPKNYLPVAAKSPPKLAKKPKKAALSRAANPVEKKPVISPKIKPAKPSPVRVVGTVPVKTQAPRGEGLTPAQLVNNGALGSDKFTAPNLPIHPALIAVFGVFGVILLVRR